jgi:hypothetical protein
VLNVPHLYVSASPPLEPVTMRLEGFSHLVCLNFLCSTIVGHKTSSWGTCKDHSVDIILRTSTELFIK